MKTAKLTIAAFLMTTFSVSIASAQDETVEQQDRVQVKQHDQTGDASGDKIQKKTQLHKSSGDATASGDKQQSQDKKQLRDGSGAGDKVQAKKQQSASQSKQASKGAKAKNAVKGAKAGTNNAPASQSGKKAQKHDAVKAQKQQRYMDKNGDGVADSMQNKRQSRTMTRAKNAKQSQSGKRASKHQGQGGNRTGAAQLGSSAKKGSGSGFTTGSRTGSKGSGSGSSQSGARTGR